ncbi:hypothetical protein K438DRAFT_1975400 [Mycena galopus ATCC 62051]|nr:hypothetical protein K438DRAFT_1975400 [Mycena galopus ATCC 62051]
MATRAAQRKQRLLELENEQRIEDAEALKFTDEQRLSLFLSFRSVKFEWSDLDGMRSVRRRYNSSCPSSPPPPARAPTHSPARPPALPYPAAPEAFAVLTNARLASFGKDETIRGYVPFPASPERRFCSTPTPYDSAPRYGAKYQSEYEYSSAPATPAPLVRSVSSPPAPVRPPPTPPPMRRSPISPKPSKSTLRGKRRSPVKGLFSIACSSSGAAACLEPIRVPLPPLVSAAPNGSAHGADDDEDAWVDEDELTVIADDDDRDDDDDGLLTPVPASAWRFGSTQPPSMGVNCGAPPALRVNCEPPSSPPSLRVNCDAPPAYTYEDPDTEAELRTPVPYEFEREATPVPFIHVSEPDDEQVGGKRKR